MDEARLVAVTGAGGRGSGYAVGPRLVLTSAHVVARKGARVKVFHPGGNRQFVGESVWCGTPGDIDDAALVVVTDASWRPPSGPDVRWGRLATTRPGQECETWGVPELIQRRGTAVEASQQRGLLNPGTGFVNNHYVMDLRAHPPSWPSDATSPWGGLSGGAMFCDRLLTGVVLAESAHSEHAALKVVPAYVLHHDDSFRAALATHGGGRPQLEAVEFQDLAAVEPTLNKGPASPAALLTADRQTVPFRGRVELMDQLRAWCDLGGFGAWLLHGPGGQGKTRIARHLAGTLAEEKWAVLWLRAGATAAELRGLRRAAKPLLIVVDYAEARTDQIAGLVEAAAEHGGGSPFKVLLLARTAGDWWSRAKNLTSITESYLEGTPDVALPPLDPDPPDRLKAYQDAAKAFAGSLSRVKGYEHHNWPRVAAKLPVPQLTREGLGNALTLQMTALADLLDEADRPGSLTTVPRPSVEERLLGHETRYWTRTAGSEGLTGMLEATLHDAVTAALLVGASDGAQAEATLRRLARLAELPRDRREAVALWLVAIFPSLDSGRLWGSLYPDRLAERFVGLRLEKDPELAEDLVQGADDLQAAQLLTVYSRAAAYPEVRGRLDDQLTGLCVRNGTRLVPQLIDVAIQTEHPGPLLAAFDRITGDQLALDELRRLVDWVPESTQRLAAWVAKAATLLTNRTRNIPPGNPNRLPLLANALIEQSNRLSNVGRHEEALAAVEEAVEVSRTLAVSDPSHLRDYAKALNNLSNRYSDFGRHEEALAAIETSVRIHSQLTGALFSEIFPNNAAVEDLSAHLSRSEEGRLSTAELLLESFDGHAMALNNLSARLSVMGRHREALEAVEQSLFDYRLLVDSDPEKYLPELARITANHGARLAAVGRRQESLAALESALASLRPMAERRPDAHLPDLAMVLGNMAVELGALGRNEEALAAAEECVATYRVLDQGHPRGTYLPVLARFVSNLSARLTAVGRIQEALAAADEAVTMFERLAEDYPDAYQAELGTALDRRYMRLTDLNQPYDALQTAVRAVDVFRDLAERFPGRHRAELARNLHHLARALATQGRRRPSLAAIDESLALHRALAAADPGAYEDLLAASEELRAGIVALPARNDVILETVDQVKAIIGEQLGIDPDDIGPDEGLVDELGADELDMVEIVMAVESAFGMDIPEEQAREMVTPQHLVRAVLAHLL
ncbi:tetratricopeptide repeat protein [Kitasatospora sp. NPDC059648]|uniref:tetratricopeptide repeat protein n=1 Tax=Kitasatospora sp. NPDC059648 TaxID=3346894 RepID=UPI0036CE2A08